jgi:hypothetical protein
MKIRFLNYILPDVNTPGDLHYLNCLTALQEKAPRCAGVESGEAEVGKVPVSVEIVDIGKTIDLVFEYIQCPDSCPRTAEAVRDRCRIREYWGEV